MAVKPVVDVSLVSRWFFCVQRFDGLRRHWLAAIDVVGRCQAGVFVGASGPAPPSRLMVGLLTDTSRVIALGDETRPRLCASLYGGMVALFLPC
jgi:hypothetical protein